MSKLRELLAARAAVNNKIIIDNKPAPVILPAPALDIRAKLAALQANKIAEATSYATIPNEPILPVPTQSTGMHGEIITYNAEQQAFINLASSGKSCVLIGAAGTGKTTCTQGAIKAIINSGNIPVLQSDGHKHLVSGSPGVITIAFTKRAVNNSKKVQSEELKNNCITAHKLLEFAPVYYDIEDKQTGTIKKTMVFEPLRNSGNPLPRSIHTIIVEEASMLSLDLYNQLMNAIKHQVQWIFIGDIQQLPPVFGPAILGFKLQELPVVELTQVYRQALESPIIRLAHRILSGKAITDKEFPEWKVENKLTIHPWKKKLEGEYAAITLAAFFKAAINNNSYDPEEDTILLPFNKGCGTVELNKHIANHLARRRQVTTYHVIAGFNDHYFSIGDKVLVEKEDAEIIEISNNSLYTGKRPKKASKYLDYWGTYAPEAKSESIDLIDTSSYVDIDIDSLLSSMADSDDEDRVNQASHCITVRLLDSDREITISKAAEVNSMLHSYALTVHKSQGSEWRKVFVCFHNSHNTMLQRELLYTAVTRAREELYIICEPDSLIKGIEKQRIKGNTLEEKAEYFKGKYMSEDN